MESAPGQGHRRPEGPDAVQAHMDAMVNRRNSINGRMYRDDPTIFAWDLMNEPRCDCFPDEIPAPPELVSCRPECAQKMQVCHCCWRRRG